MLCFSIDSKKKKKKKNPSENVFSEQPSNPGKIAVPLQ